MDDAAVAQARQRVMHWIEESREVFGLMPEVLLGSKADEAEKLARELADVRKHRDGLLKEVETLRRERDEVAQAFAKLLETVQSTNQIAQKLGVTKSPFARPGASPAAPAPGMGPVPVAQPAGAAVPAVAPAATPPVAQK
ncbi:MAG TPA: hypothetical protein VLA62_11040 [Solirubrobacterales bacterium]|nr:hypothetical protein [Solirubrobacterales bacterium]